jgi:hypothetical protein
MHHTSMIAWGKRVVLVTLVLFLAVACKKQESPYFLSITQQAEQNFQWESDKIDAVILNDSLLVVATKRNGSGVSIIANGNEVGEYQIQLNNLEALVTFDQTGQKKPESTFISASGTLNIVQKNVSNKTISGFFMITSVNGLLSNPVNFEGEFSARYKD